MEGEDLNCLYQILESSSHFPPPMDSLHGFFTPQNCFIPPYQTFTNPQNGAVENLNVNPEKRGKRKQKKRSKEKATWYKGPWTKIEDRKLCRLVVHYGRGQWASIAQHMTGRIGKQCRERYHNNLFPNIKKSRVWSEEEEMMIIEGHKKFGNRWSTIAKFLPGRSENAVKNHWNSIKRRLSSSKQIARPHALHESKLLENYIKRKYFRHETTTPTPSAPPAFTITTGARTFSAADAAFAPPPTTILGENYDALIETGPPLSVDDYVITTGARTFSAADAAFAPPPATVVGEIYDTLMEMDPPLSVDDYYITTGARTVTVADAAFAPPPTATVGENYDTLMETDPPLSVDDYDITAGARTFSAADPAFAPPPTAIVGENYDTLNETDPPLSVDDYDTGGVPNYFTFESAIDENLDLMLPYLNAINEVLDSIHSGDGGIHPSPFTGDADSAASMCSFEAETVVDEEMGFLGCLFGSNGEILF